MKRHLKEGDDAAILSALLLSDASICTQIAAARCISAEGRGDNKSTSAVPMGAVSDRIKRAELMDSGKAHNYEGCSNNNDISDPLFDPP